MEETSVDFGARQHVADGLLDPDFKVCDDAGHVEAEPELLHPLLHQQHEDLVGDLRLVWQPAPNRRNPETVVLHHPQELLFPQLCA